MTTWDNTDISKTTRNTHGKIKERIYELTGVSGDTGGTLTVTGFSKINNCAVTACTSSAVCAALTWRISTNTVVVAYTDPTAGHTVFISVWGT